jgi:hypothetical protein
MNAAESEEGDWILFCFRIHCPLSQAEAVLTELNVVIAVRCIRLPLLARHCITDLLATKKILNE